VTPDAKKPQARDPGFVELLRTYQNQTYVREGLGRVLALKLATEAVPLPTVRQGHPRLDETVQADIVRRYQAGETAMAISLSVCVTRNSVLAVLERHGVPRRYRVVDDSMVERAKELYAKGQSVAVVAHQLGVSARTIHSILTDAEVVMRPVGTNQWA
jgi:hypothetical protein